MIHNSCNAPDACDCLDCEYNGIPTKLMSIKTAVQMIKPKRKELNRDSRVLAIKNHYSDIQSEFTEDNIPTNLFTLFEEFLKGVPASDLAECNTTGLFEDALSERLQYDGITLNKKKYI